MTDEMPNLQADALPRIDSDKVFPVERAGHAPRVLRHLGAETPEEVSARVTAAKAIGTE